jgi:antitoxin StbD
MQAEIVDRQMIPAAAGHQFTRPAGPAAARFRCPLPAAPAPRRPSPCRSPLAPKSEYPSWHDAPGQTNIPVPGDNGRLSATEKKIGLPPLFASAIETDRCRSKLSFATDAKGSLKVKTCDFVEVSWPGWSPPNPSENHWRPTPTCWNPTEKDTQRSILAERTKYGTEIGTFNDANCEGVMQRVEASVAVSVSDLKKSPTAVMDEAQGEAVAVLNHNRIIAYMVPANVYESMLEQLDDLYLTELVKERANEKGEPVDINDL